VFREKVGNVLHGGGNSRLDRLVGDISTAYPSVEHIGKFVHAATGFFDGSLAGSFLGVDIGIVSGLQKGSRLLQVVQHGSLVSAKDGIFDDRGRMASDGAIKVDVACGTDLAQQPGSVTKARDAY